MHRIATLLVTLFTLSLAAPAQQPRPAAPPSTAPAEKPAEKKEAEKKEPEPEMREEPPVVTQHEIRIAGRVLRYTATAGKLPIKNAEGKTEAQMFFIAYTAENPGGKPRPLMFSFNGGPGSSSVWLHLGALGPRRVHMLPDGGMPKPPFELVDNDQTWLDMTDLVFIDPVGTGYSRAANAELGKKFWSLKGDIASVGEFIRLYLTRYDRWNSPLFLIGESYGTTRAAGLSGYLIEKGIAFNGVVLVSSVLNFGTHDFGRMNDLPYELILPTYTMTAAFHKKLAPELAADLAKTRKEVEQWALTGYAEALAKGDRLTPDERRSTVERLARYTGLSPQFVDNSNMRVPLWRFNKELLRDRRRTVGRLDSRFTGFDENAATDRPEFDPSLAAIRPPYTADFAHYVRSELGYKTDLEYYILGGGIGRWDLNAENEYADTSDDLRSAFAKNPHMKLFVASGYYDMATPYFATHYTLDHLGIDPSLRPNITTAEYDAGHMMYIDQQELVKLKRDAAAFVQKALQ